MSVLTPDTLPGTGRGAFCKSRISRSVWSAPSLLALWDGACDSGSKLRALQTLRAVWRGRAATAELRNSEAPAALTILPESVNYEGWLRAATSLGGGIAAGRERREAGG